MRAPAPLRLAFELAERERRFLLAEILQVRGLMPVLMKRRNLLQWTPEDMAEIRGQLRRISKLSPYLVVMLMPGGFAALPVLAWWLDRRRAQRGSRLPAKSA